MRNQKQQLKSLYNATLNLSLLLEDKGQLLEVLAKHQSIFPLKVKEERLYSLVEFAIDTGDTVPRKHEYNLQNTQPYAAKEEINVQLAKLQIARVIQPSEACGPPQYTASVLAWLKPVACYSQLQYTIQQLYPTAQGTIWFVRNRACAVCTVTIDCQHTANFYFHCIT